MSPSNPFNPPPPVNIHNGLAMCCILIAGGSFAYAASYLGPWGTSLAIGAMWLVLAWFFAKMGGTL